MAEIQTSESIDPVENNENTPTGNNENETEPQTYGEGTYLTAKGISLIGKLLACEGELRLTRVSCGNGDLPEGKTPRTMTELSQYQCEGTIASCESNGNGEATVTIQVSSEGLGSGFACKEIGIWAEDPDDGEILYTYVMLSEHPEWIRSTSAAVNKIAEFTIVFIVDSIPVVTAYINPAAYATQIDLSRYALKNHRHTIDDIDGLREWMIYIENRILILYDLIKGDMPDSTSYNADFRTLSNIEVIEGRWDSDARTINA